MRPERGQRPEPQDRVPDAAIRSELKNVLETTFGINVPAGPDVDTMLERVLRAGA